MRTYFCFLIPRTDVSAYLLKRCALLLFVSLFVSVVNLRAQQKCVGALDSIQQVCIAIACDGTITISWDGHPDKCYGFSLESGIISTSGLSSASISFSNTAPGLNSMDKFFITEACGGGLNPCIPPSGSPLKVDIFSGILPKIDSVGLWKFASSGSTTNTKDTASVFTLTSPSNIPNLLAISAASAHNTNIIRPSGSATTDAEYSIQVNFNPGSLDSIQALGANITGFLSSGLLGGGIGSFIFPINMPGIGAGTHVNQIALFSGACRDTLTLSTLILPGSDEPTMACYGSLAISISGNSTAITPAMMLPGQSTADKVILINGIRDSIVTCAHVGQRLKVTVLDTVFNQKCWGYMLIEDKSIMTASAIDTIVTCLFNLDSLFAKDFVTINDNCTLFSDVQITYADEFTDYGCTNADTLKVIDRTWILKDPKGNIVNTKSKITIIKVPFDTIVFPGDTTLYCPDTVLTTQFTGGINFSIDTLAVKCMLMVGYTDNNLPVGCDGMKKIQRSWLAIDWCNNIQKDTVQLITLLDTLPPTVTCHGDSIIFTNADTCGAYYVLNTVAATDSCSDDNLITFDIRVDSVFLIGKTFGDSVFLPVGTSVIEYIAIDDCGNRGSCTDTITVKDGASPIINGPTSIQIAFGGGNTVIPKALILGAYQITDNCGLDSTFIRRLANDCGVPSDTIFGQSITVCCEDTDSVIMVQLLARDTSGNSATIMIAVDVKDAISPSVTCRDTTTIYLNANGVFTITDSSLFVSNITDNCLDVSIFQLSRDSFVRADTVAPVSLQAKIVDLEGNADSCVTVVLVRDTFSNPFNALIVATIVDPFNDALRDMNVNLLVDGVNVAQTQSNENGIFHFDHQSIDPNFGIQFIGKGNQMDGVSSLDLYLIQRHILGIERLENVYLEMAGDIDQNEKLDIKDLLQLQNALLDRIGHPDLPWLFMNENISASDLVYVTNDIIPARPNNFLYRGIKLGDTSGDVYSDTKPRSTQIADLLLTNIEIVKGENYEIPLHIWSAEQMVSFEFTIDLNSFKNLSFHPNLTLEDVVIDYMLDENLLKVVGYAKNAKRSKTQIGVIEVVGNVSGELKTFLGNEPTVLVGRSYNSNLHESNIGFGWIDPVDDVKHGTAQIFKIYPNPANFNVNFEFGIQMKDVRKITIYDIVGNQIKDLSKMNIPNFSLPTAIFPSSGTYIINVETADAMHSEILLVNKM